jgi:type I pantothenate kinase
MPGARQPGSPAATAGVRAPRPDRYVSFSRDEWAALRASTPLPLSERELETLRGINERISLDEVTEVYLPLARLLHLHVEASRALAQVTDTFLGKPAGAAPYVIGIAGSVAVGKSTTARILQALLSRWDGHPRVDLVTTDGFLFPNRVLAERGLMTRKGFPESYDLRHLLSFLADVKAGVPEVAAPLYSHLAYDIVEGEEQVVRRPDVVIVEGLNVLQTGDLRDHRGGFEPRLFVSDFFDFSLYVDADEDDIERWYIERFLTLRETTFREPGSHFHQYAALDPDESVTVARAIWREINGRNLVENIQPTRERAHLILEKGPDHRVREIRLRKR